MTFLILYVPKHFTQLNDTDIVNIIILSIFFFLKNTVTIGSILSTNHWYSCIAETKIHKFLLFLLLLLFESMFNIPYFLDQIYVMALFLSDSIILIPLYWFHFAIYRRLVVLCYFVHQKCVNNIWLLLLQYSLLYSFCFKGKFCIHTMVDHIRQ